VNSKRQMARPPLSVVVPVRDEAENVGPLLEEIVHALDEKIEFELLFVDDGSRDGTVDGLVELLGGEPRLRLLQHGRRAGQSAALATGVRAARGRWIATLDGDGQNDPADILPLLAALEDADPLARVALVCGHRRARNDPWLRRVSSRIANAVRGRVLGDHTPDGGCGLKVFERARFLEIPHFDHMHRFLPALFRRQGWEVRSVPVAHRPRRHGRSKYGVRNRLWTGLIDLLGVLWLSARPLEPLPTRSIESPPEG
jgi:dolichol-phosphate mannosyltransferase